VLDILAKAVEETSVILGEKFSSYETWMENWWEEEKNYEREDEAIDLASAGDKKARFMYMQPNSTLTPQMK